MVVADRGKHGHNKLDPQGPTKTEKPAPVLFPALHQHRRVSRPNHLHLSPIPFPFYPHFYPAVPWSSFYLMTRPTRTVRDRKVQPPRPPNAWILYRSYQFKQIQVTHANERLSQATVSKMISDMWKRETDDVKRQFEQEAETMKAKHQELYPDYRFCPKRKENKLTRKKSKIHDITSEDVDDGGEADEDVPPVMPAPPPMPSLYQAHTPLIPGYHPNMIVPQPYLIAYLPQVHYPPGSHSPLVSAVPSPAPSESPLQSRSAASSASSLNPSTRPSPSSVSRASSSSSIHLPSFPNSHHPSPNPYATLPVSTLVNSTPGEIFLTSPQPHLPAENTPAPPPSVWHNAPNCLPNPDSQNSEVVTFDVPLAQTQDFTEFQEGLPSNLSFDSLQGLLSVCNEGSIFNVADIESSALLSPPQGDLEVTMCPPLPSPVDYSEIFLGNIDFDEFQRQMESLRESDSSSTQVVSHLAQEDIQPLFHTPNNPDPQAYTAAQQCQPSAFTQDMMSFLNFDIADDPTEDTSSVPPAQLPTTVAPQQVRHQDPQITAAMPILTQMTNTPTITPGTSYVPPTGAIYSSTRRVASSWKLPFVDPPQLDEHTHSWAF